MGCNTSQESVPKAEENDKNAEEKKEMTKGDNKPESAKTITLTSNGTALSGGDNATTDHKQSKELQDPEAESEEDELEKAAAKIQAAFRGHQTRKSMKQPSKHEEAEPTREELERDFRPEDTELCHAATKIQASFRGHMTRKEMDKNKDDGGVSPNKSKAEEAEELDIDLSDPDLNKAAVKIQASFRGHMARKDEHESEQK